MILQQGIIILLIFHLPCWGLLINSEATLLYLGQDPGVAPFRLESFPPDKNKSLCSFLFQHVTQNYPFLGFQNKIVHYRISPS